MTSPAGSAYHAATGWVAEPGSAEVRGAMQDSSAVAAAKVSSPSVDNAVPYANTLVVLAAGNVSGPYRRGGTGPLHRLQPVAFAGDEASAPASRCPGRHVRL